MAAQWIKIEGTTPDKPEVGAMAERLGIDPDAVLGKLVRFWMWADLQTLGCCAFGVTKTQLDRITFCAGFADAMIEVGWLSYSDGAATIPNFDRHNGETAKKRCQSNDRMAKSRKRCAESVTKAQQCYAENATPPSRNAQPDEDEDIRESVSARARDAAIAADASRIVETYPRREGVAEALSIVAGQLRNGADAEAMLAGTRACAAVISTAPAGAANRYVPSAKAFFERARWRDDPETIIRRVEAKPGQAGVMSREDAIAALGGRYDESAG